MNRVVNRLFVLAFYMQIIFISSAFAQSPAAVLATPEKVADGFQFVEGPLWVDSLGLLFSDIGANTTYLWSPSTNTVTTYLKPSGKGNGLALDAQKRLLIAQQGDRKVVRLEPNGTLTALAALYGGKKLNSPNDLAVKSDGAIFFTDPPYGIVQNQKELGYSGIFRIGSTGSLTLLDKTLANPNGIAFSPDEKLLYVSDAEVRKIYIWDVVSDSLIVNKRQFAAMTPSGYADGLKIDAAGNLFATGPGGVWVYAPNGTLLQKILVPGQTTNCGWGDADRQTLYITSGTAVYKVRSPFASVRSSEDSGRPADFQLYPNYPNPFNSATTIRFNLTGAGLVSLKAYSILGKEVGELVNGEMPAGAHSVVWDAQGLPSGLYHVLLESGKSRLIRKALLVK
jgi:gluconolactonase